MRKTVLLVVLLFSIGCLPVRRTKLVIPSGCVGISVHALPSHACNRRMASSSATAWSSRLDVFLSQEGKVRMARTTGSGAAVSDGIRWSRGGNSANQTSNL